MVLPSIDSFGNCVMFGILETFQRVNASTPVDLVGCGLLVVMLKEETGKKLDSDLAHSPVSFLSYLVMGVKQGR